MSKMVEMAARLYDSQPFEDNLAMAQVLGKCYNFGFFPHGLSWKAARYANEILPDLLGVEEY